MSYILEALRRAERERTFGQAPATDAWVVSTPPATAPVPRTRLLVIASAVLAAAALSAWLLRSADPAAPVALPAAAPSPSQNELPQAVAGEAGAAADAPDRAAEPLAIETQAALASLDDLAAPFSAAPEQTPAPAAVPAVVSRRTAAAGPAAAALAAPTAPLTGPAADTWRAPESAAEQLTSDVAPASAESASLEPSDAEPAVANGPPLLRDMPSEYRAAFPSLAVQVHVYDERPERRWILVGNRRYLEGATLEAGPQIVEIQPSGVVFAHHGRQVLWPLVR